MTADVTATQTLDQKVGGHMWAIYEQYVFVLWLTEWSDQKEIQLLREKGMSQSYASCQILPCFSFDYFLPLMMALW